MNEKANFNEPAPLLAGYTEKIFHSNDFNFDLESYSSETGFIDCTIDRLTIVGNLDVDEFLGVLEPFDLPEYTSYPTNDGFKGEYFSKTYNQKIFVSFEPSTAYKMGKRNFRLDCNPNLLSYGQWNLIFEKIIPFVKDIGITRVDLAFDYSRPLQDLKISKRNGASKVVYYEKNGSINTTVLGRRTSETVLKVYNKKLERIEKSENALEREFYNSFDDYWRIEFELRKSSFIDDVIRSKASKLFMDYRIDYVDYNTLLPLTPREKIMIASIDEHPNEFALLSAPTKRKLKQIKDKMVLYNFTQDFYTLISAMRIIKDKPKRISLLDFLISVKAGKNVLRGE